MNPITLVSNNSLLTATPEEGRQLAVKMSRLIVKATQPDAQKREAAMCSFCEVAQTLNDTVKPASNETRIQNFFREMPLDNVVLSSLRMSLRLATGKLRLCPDRTEWDFGQCPVNILLSTVGCGAWYVPLCYTGN